MLNKYRIRTDMDDGRVVYHVQVLMSGIFKDKWVDYVPYCEFDLDIAKSKIDAYIKRDKKELADSQYEPKYIYYP